MSPQPLDIVGIAEIAELGEMSVANVKRLRREGTLPPPDRLLRMGPVWRRSTIERFLAEPRPAGGRRIPSHP